MLRIVRDQLRTTRDEGYWFAIGRGVCVGLYAVVGYYFMARLVETCLFGGP
jgi:hypothetical protein